MIWTVTPNPAVDVTYQMERVELGQVHRVETILRKPGGKGLNTARVLAQNGIDVSISGFLGGTAGQQLRADLAELAPTLPGKITERWVEVPWQTRTSVAITQGNEATVFNEVSQPLPAGSFARLTQLVSGEVKPGDRVSINGSLPVGTAPGELGQLVDALKTAGAGVLVDTSGAYLLEAAQAGADLLKPNEEELLEATGAPNVGAGVRQLLSLGAGRVLVSRGEEGLWLLGRPEDSGADVRTAPLPRWSVKPAYRVAGNPTGAGDALVAGLLAGWDGPVEDQLLRGASWSGGAVARPAAGDIDPEVAKDLASKTTVNFDMWEES